MVQEMAEDHQLRKTSPGNGSIDNAITDGCCVLPDSDFTFEEENKKSTPRDDRLLVDDDARTFGGLSGLKRTVSSGFESKQSKRDRKSPSNNYSNGINAAMIQEMDPNLTFDEANAVLHDYNHAMKILKTLNTGKEAESRPSLESMIRLLNDWKPKSDIICMYVRWSKRLRRNYHLDSISTLLCVANQCDYTPHVFLKNIKTLTISSSTTTYGLNFKFDTCNNVSVDGQKLNEKFLGLSITLRLLQRGIISNFGTMGNIGLKTSKKKKSCNEDIYMSPESNANKKYVISNKPTSRFHTNGGLLGRIWLAIQHRWISIQVVEILFPVQLANAKTEQESLIYSFQIHSAAGPTRYDFLDPLIGVCLRFRSTSIINNHADVLQTVWDNPSSFVSFGNGYLQSTSEKDAIKYVAETFNYLKSLIKTRKPVTLHKKTEREVRWQMIRGYAFHFWLERVKNQKMRMAVDRQCKGPPVTTRDRLHKTMDDDKLTSPPHTKGISVHNDESTCPKLSSFQDTGETESAEYYPENQRDRDTISEISTCIGLSSLLSTRQEITPPEHDTDSCCHSITTTPTKSISSVDPTSFAWNTIRLTTKSEISSRVSSHLLIHRDDGVDVVAELSPLEVYSADMLYKLRHSRWTGRRGQLPTLERGKAIFTIGADIDKFIDQASKIFHVAREDSNYFKEHASMFPSIQHLTNLCQAVLKYGKCDETRSPQQFRINIGCGGQHRPAGKPATLVGLNFQRSLSSDPAFNQVEVLGTIGRLTEITWDILRDMQVDSKDNPLAPDQTRQLEYARHLANFLRMGSHVGFEDVTVVVGVLYPTMPNVFDHVDGMNDSVAGYTRTGVFSVVLTIGNDDDVVLLLLQVICTFRRVIREYLFPYHSSLSNITLHCKQYLSKWQANMNQVYGGKTANVPSPFDRSNFFVDDCLPFETITISNRNIDTAEITGDYLLTVINPSRVLSFSLFIDPIVDLKGILCYDQRIELCFAASMLSNPFWFEQAITSLTQKHMDPDNLFSFGVHPIYNWAEETNSLFGAWQGGPRNRWSPCGGNTPFPNLFGAHSGATEEEQVNGRTKLEAVVQVLYHHLQWVDSLSDKEVTDVIRDLPISFIESHMNQVTEAIHKIIPCQFNGFRLMVFTTLAAGCGEIKSGPHLKAMMYPVKGSASYKHLMNPNQDKMTRETALSLFTQGTQQTDFHTTKIEGVDQQCHDQMMLYLSNELGMQKYIRDETECILCEAHPNRNLLCCDWFKKGRRIYDLNMDGTVLQREYGMRTQWTLLATSDKVNFAFLKERIVYQEADDLIKKYATAFGEDLRMNKCGIRFCGRHSKTSDYIQEYNNNYFSRMSKPFPAIQHRAANFYHGDYTRQLNINAIEVLGDGEISARLDSECNDITTYANGVSLWNHVLSILYGPTKDHVMYSARYHQHHEEEDLITRTTIFPGHVDKAFVASAVFLPLTQREFYSILAVPISWHVKQDEKSKVIMQRWMKDLPTEETEMVQQFLRKFLVSAEITMKVKVELRIFFSSVGSLLAFPANVCFHTTIVPGTMSGVKNPRDLFVIHTTIDKTQ